MTFRSLRQQIFPSMWSHSKSQGSNFFVFCFHTIRLLVRLMIISVRSFNLFLSKKVNEVFVASLKDGIENELQQLANSSKTPSAATIITFASSLATVVAEPTLLNGDTVVCSLVESIFVIQKCTRATGLVQVAVPLVTSGTRNRCKFLFYRNRSRHFEFPSSLWVGYNWNQNQFRTV